MTLAEMKRFVGMKTAMLNSAGQYVDNMVSEDDLTSLINIRAKELFWKLKEQHPDFFTTREPLNVENGKSTYLLGEGTGDDLSYVYTITDIAIKYSSAATAYTRAKRVEYGLRAQQSTDFSQTPKEKPEYYTGTEIGGDNNKPRRSFTLIPTPDADVTNGLLIGYVKEPTDLSGDTDFFESIPTPAHHLIPLAVIADVWEIKEDWVKSDKALNRYLKAEDDFLSAFQPRASDEPVRVQLNRVFDPYVRRS